MLAPIEFAVSTGSMTLGDQLFSWIANHLLAPAIVALTFSWLLMLLVEGHRARRDSLTKQVDAVRDSLMVMWDIASEYWHRRGDATRDPLIVEKIMLAEQDLRFAAAEVAAQLGAHLDPATMSTMIAEITDAATNGRFQDLERDADPERVAKLRVAIVVVRDRLLTARNARLKDTFKLH